MAGERTRRVTTLLPVALLAALVVVQSVTGDAGAIVVEIVSPQRDWRSSCCCCA